MLRISGISLITRAFAEIAVERNGFFEEATV
jgi:hypothetical protein